MTAIVATASGVLTAFMFAPDDGSQITSVFGRIMQAGVALLILVSSCIGLWLLGTAAARSWMLVYALAIGVVISSAVLISIIRHRPRP